jgi:hypothetical protein
VAGTGVVLLTGALLWRWMPANVLPVGGGAPERVAVDMPAAASASPLGLKVARTANDLELSWNRMSDAIRYASTGTLTIRNGAVLRTIDVTPEQLHEGRVVYHPISGVDVNVRMEVMTSDGRREAESVEFLGFDTVPPTTPPETRPAPPSRSAPPQRSRPRPIPLQNADRIEKSTPNVRRAASGPQTEPVPIRRANPDLSRDVRSEMQAAKGKVSVSVLASIDSAGTVQSVKVVSSTGEPSPSGPYIRLAALNAARQWRFRPATAGGRAIPSQTTLVFNF